MKNIDNYIGPSADFEPLTYDKYRNSRSLNALDLLKFIMALGVMVIHVNPLYTINPFLNSVFVFGFGRLAVPFFFVSSAWLLFRNGYKADVLRSVKRLLIMYIIWTIIYLPTLMADDSANMLILSLRNIIFGGHLWYLISSACALLIILGMQRLRMKPKIIFAVAFLPFTIGILLSGYNEILNMVGLKSVSERYFDYFISVRNGLFFGFPYMAAGLILSVNNKTYKKRSAITALAVLYVMHLIEFVIVRKLDLTYTTDMTMIAMPFTILLVYVVVHINLKDRKIYKILRNSSILIYLIHPYVIMLYDKIVQFDNSIIKYILVCCLSMMFSMMILKLEQYKYFKMLKYLH